MRTELQLKESKWLSKSYALLSVNSVCGGGFLYFNARGFARDGRRSQANLRIILAKGKMRDYIVLLETNSLPGFRRK